ncbi:hypothetical protein ACFUJR_31055 [Streptomyces sp. NPDC057271]|uniref:hypothetical protein n=1 Tax=Streptomyces sp. NPDC057271 TaxID=3346078 RepID=UPI003625D873
MSELHTAGRGVEANPWHADAIEAGAEHAEPEEPREPEELGEPENREAPQEPEAPEEPEGDPDGDGDGPDPGRAFLGDVFSKLRDTIAGPREPAEGPVDRYATVGPTGLRRNGDPGNRCDPLRVRHTSGAPGRTAHPAVRRSAQA